MSPAASKPLYAHSSAEKSKAQWQLLHTGNPERPGHLDAVALLASHFASKFGGQDWARVAGLWHDLGKFSDEFQAYLDGANDSDDESDSCARGPDHSTAGAQHAAAVLPSGIGKLVAYLIAGHHSGLADGESSSRSCLSERLRKPVCTWQPNVSPSLLVPSPLGVPPQLLDRSASAADNAARLALFLRFVFSALVDADFLDTEKFMSPLQAASRAHPMPTVLALESRLSAYMRALDRSAATDHVNGAREIVHTSCLRAAELPPGFFSLTVPTGGGKTLSSLAFSLRHALRHDLRRVIYAIPFTSIVEQTAAVFRSALGDETVLEHHCNFDPQSAHETAAQQRAVENWDSPVVVTTNVQLFESLFASRPSRCRKLHRIAGSVIILDEAQAIPVELLRPSLFALRELVRAYGCTVVLCTATQPAIHRREEFDIGIEGVREIVDNPSGLFRSLERVRVERRGAWKTGELAADLARHHRALAIVRTRREAAELYGALPSDGARLHLSGRMCAAHRTQVLNAVRERLNRNEDCRLVSTNLIEAGVDVDFPVVYRALAGLDALAQAAGRCNRGGLLNAQGSLGRLVVYGTPEECPPGYLRRSAQDTAEVMSLPEGADPLSLPAIARYFEKHYWSQQARWDEKRVMECFPDCRTGVELQFATAADRFRMIDDAYRPVVVPFDKRARELIETLLRGAPAARDTFRALQRYVVTVPERTYARHVGSMIQLVAQERIAVLVDAPGVYDPALGLRLDDESPLYNPQSLILG